MKTGLFIACIALCVAASCASWTGYDPSRYADDPSPDASNVETAPLPREPRPRMLDPRSPLDAAAD